MKYYRIIAITGELRSLGGNSMVEEIYYATNEDYEMVNCYAASFCEEYARKFISKIHYDMSFENWWKKYDNDLTIWDARNKWYNEITKYIESRTYHIIEVDYDNYKSFIKRGEK